MKEFQGKVAVITGGASGLGRAMAERFARAGMSIVLADVEPNALAKAEAEMKAAGAKVIGVRTDVSKAAEVEALAQQTLAAFGGVPAGRAPARSFSRAYTPARAWRPTCRSPRSNIRTFAASGE